MPVVPPPPPVQAPTPAAAPLRTEGGAGGYQRAPLGGRLLAYIADSIIASALIPLGVLLVNASLLMGDAPVLGGVILTLGILWMVGYLIGRDAVRGAGPGKRLTGLVVVSAENGYPAKTGQAVVRQVVMLALGLIPAIGGLIEPILVLVDKDGRRLGDKAAKTQVVRSSEVIARGMMVPAGKGAAVALVIVALLVSMVGSVIGGIAIARAAGGQVDGQPVVEDPFAPDVDTPAEAPGASTEPVTVPQTPDASPSEEPVTAPEAPPVEVLTPESAVDAVGNLLNDLKENDVDRARTFTTRYFQEEYDWFLYPSGGALINFEVTEVYRDNAIFVVETYEEWNSGPETVMYFVIVEDGQARVDELAHPDY